MSEKNSPTILDLSSYVKSIEASEIIISIVSGCMVMSIIYHSLHAPPMLSFILGVMASYAVIELRRGKGYVPTRILEDQLKHLKEVAWIGSDLESSPSLENLQKEADLVQSLYDCLEVGKKNLPSYGEVIRNAETFCEISHKCLDKDFSGDCQDCYTESDSASVRVLNSLHSLIYSVEDMDMVENIITIIRNSIRIILSNVRERCGIIGDPPARASVGVRLPSQYDFF